MTTVVLAAVVAGADDDVGTEAVVALLLGSVNPLAVPVVLAVEASDDELAAAAFPVLAGEWPPRKIEYAAMATTPIPAIMPTGTSHLRFPPLRAPAIGNPSSSNLPARSDTRSANAAPAGSRRLSSTRERTPGGMNECGSSSYNRSGRRVFIAAPQIPQRSMWRETV